ncbi:holin [Aurantimonas phage AmM-1]|uniref:holin n=1 Tax=Aurantimonas phage AmM-1 TaxID=1503929 RepID=UPI000540B3BF|nr:holin [Aurantimonas phage AmM-1]BAP94486.1 holin [Aurantimonas phage AmM-1]
MAQLVNQPTKRASRKVNFATAGGAVGVMAAVIVGGLLSRFVGVPFDDPLVVSGWPVIGAALGARYLGYFARERAPEPEA